MQGYNGENAMNATREAKLEEFFRHSLVMTRLRRDIPVVRTLTREEWERLCAASEAVERLTRELTADDPFPFM